MTNTDFSQQYTGQLQSFKELHIDTIAAGLEWLQSLGLALDEYFEPIRKALRESYLKDAREALGADANEDELLDALEDWLGLEWEHDVAAVFWLHGLDKGQQCLRDNVPKVLTPAFYIKAARAAGDDTGQDVQINCLESAFEEAWALFTADQRKQFLLRPEMQKLLEGIEANVVSDPEKVEQALADSPALFE